MTKVRLYTAIKYFLFCSWQAKYSKTVLICTSSFLLKIKSIKSAPNTFFKLIKRHKFIDLKNGLGADFINEDVEVNTNFE